MSFRKLSALGAVLATAAVAVPATASAVTLGDVATADPGACSVGSQSLWLLQTGSTTAQYVVPPGGGLITSWSTSFGPAGAPVELIVTQPQSGGGFPTIGVDPEILPTPIPAGHVSTFTLNHAVVVQAGDLIGLWYTGGSNTRCFQPGGGADTVAAGTSVPMVGTALVPLLTQGMILTNVSANLLTTSDVALTGTAAPSAVTSGSNAQLTFPVTANPGGSGTFTDTLPAGLTPQFAAAGTNSCTISGQAVSCPLSTLPATVDIAVRGTTAGTYTDTAAVANSITESNPANNTTQVTLAVVNPPPTPQCTVPKLKGAPVAVAKSVLPLVNCTVGKVTKAKSKSVAKGKVISTNPGGGKKLAAGTKVAIKQSSGKPKKKSKKKH